MTTFITEPTRTTNRNSYAKESIELNGFIALVKRVSGHYDPSAIQILDLSRAQLKLMNCFQLLQWNSLISLDLSHNKIRSIEGLQSLSRLERLDLSFNNLKDIPERFISNSNNNLQSLRLEGNVELKDVECIRRLSIVSGTLTRLAFQRVESRDACPLCQCAEYHALIFEVCPSLITIDEGSVEVTKSFFEYKRTADAANRKRSLQDEGSDVDTKEDASIVPSSLPKIDFGEHERLNLANKQIKDAIHKAQTMLESYRLE